MKKALIILAILLTTVALQAQESQPPANTLPAIDVKTLDGQTINTSLFTNNGKPIIISFWATWCKPCVKELTTISEVYEEWQEETGVKLIAISIDDSRTQASVAPLVNAKGWLYEVYIDLNQDFKRAMNVDQVPHTFILDSTGTIVWQHSTFSEGAELELIDLIRKLNRGESITE